MQKKYEILGEHLKKFGVLPTTEKDTAKVILFGSDKGAKKWM